VSTEHPETQLARTRLAAMVASDVDPVLSTEELTDLLARNVALDGDGNLPLLEGEANPDWTPSYALGAAAQDGWLLKAGKVAARVDGADGGLRLSRSQLHAHCLAMADRYAARRYGSMPLAPVTRDSRLNVLNDDGPGGMTQDAYGPRPLPGGAV
jgi:hypothetical protein